MYTMHNEPLVTQIPTPVSTNSPVPIITTQSPALLVENPDPLVLKSPSEMPSVQPQTQPSSQVTTSTTMVQPDATSVKQEQQGVIFTIRRFNKRGGHLVRCPSTLSELKQIASQTFKIDAFSFRTLTEEAEIKDPSLILTNMIVLVLTKEEEEKEFS